MNDTRSKVVAHILKEFAGRFRVFDNTGSEKKIIAGQFPDVILMRKEPPPNTDILFLMRVESGTDSFVNSIAEWQALSSTPSVFYVIVPQSKRDEAQKLMSITAPRARIASYQMEGDEVKAIQYE